MRTVLTTTTVLADGGRLSDELAYTVKWLGEGSGTTYEMLIQTPPGHVSNVDVGAPSSSGVLSVKSMLQHLEAVRAATTLSVEVFDVYVACFRHHRRIFAKPKFHLARHVSTRHDTFDVLSASSE